MRVTMHILDLINDYRLLIATVFNYRLKKMWGICIIEVSSEKLDVRTVKLNQQSPVCPGHKHQVGQKPPVKTFSIVLKD